MKVQACNSHTNFNSIKTLKPSRAVRKVVEIKSCSPKGITGSPVRLESGDNFLERIGEDPFFRGSSEGAHVLMVASTFLSLLGGITATKSGLL